MQRCKLFKVIPTDLETQAQKATYFLLLACKYNSFQQIFFARLTRNIQVKLSPMGLHSHRRGMEKTGFPLKISVLLLLTWLTLSDTQKNETFHQFSKCQSSHSLTQN